MKPHRYIDILAIAAGDARSLRQHEARLFEQDLVRFRERPEIGTHRFEHHVGLIPQRPGARRIAALARLKCKRTYVEASAARLLGLISCRLRCSFGCCFHD
jgi:hypothetical protein